MWPCCGKFIVCMTKKVHINGPQLLAPYHGHALVRLLPPDKDMIPGKDATGAHAQDDVLLLPILKTFAKCTRFTSYLKCLMFSVCLSLSLCVCVCVCVCV